MRSATLPPDLASIAREATRDGVTPKPQRTATITGLGHWIPSEVVPNSALTERRVFLESWLYAPESHQLGYERVARGEVFPFPERMALNDAAFDRASPAALRELRRRYGVDYLVVDKLHGTASPRLRRLGPPAFENEAVTVYRLDAG